VIGAPGSECRCCHCCHFWQRLGVGGRRSRGQRAVDEPPRRCSLPRGLAVAGACPGAHARGGASTGGPGARALRPILGGGGTSAGLGRHRRCLRPRLCRAYRLCRCIEGAGSRGGFRAGAVRGIPVLERLAGTKQPMPPASPTCEACGSGTRRRCADSRPRRGPVRLSRHRRPRGAPGREGVPRQGPPGNTGTGAPHRNRIQVGVPGVSGPALWVWDYRARRFWPTSSWLWAAVREAGQRADSACAQEQGVRKALGSTQRAQGRARLRLITFGARRVTILYRTATGDGVDDYKGGLQLIERQRAARGRWVGRGWGRGRRHSSTAWQQSEP
jgi:hypothetical protein